MVNNETQYVPFTSSDELEFHFDASIILIERLKETIGLMVQCEGDSRTELEESATKSMHVLIDGFASAILSIQQGYVK
jgi:hypothetical protein